MSLCCMTSANSASHGAESAESVSEAKPSDGPVPLLRVAARKSDTSNAVGDGETTLRCPLKSFPGEEEALDDMIPILFMTLNFSSMERGPCTRSVCLVIGIFNGQRRRQSAGLHQETLFLTYSKLL